MSPSVNVPLLRFACPLVVLLALSAGCGGSGGAGGATTGRVMQAVQVRVSGTAESKSSADCFLLLTSQVVGGGTSTYCLEKFTGEPGPNAVVESTGKLTFHLPKGDIRSDVRVSQTFEADGRHAEQRLSGTVTGGTGDYAGTTGKVTGGGPNVESPPGTIRSSDLRYEIDFG